MASFTYLIHMGRSFSTKEPLPADVTLTIAGVEYHTFGAVAEVEVESDFSETEGFSILKVDMAPARKGEPWHIVEDGDFLFESFKAYVEQPHIANEIRDELAERDYDRRMERVYG